MSHARYRMRSKKYFTPFALVNITQLYVSIFSIAPSRSSQRSGGTILIVGKSTGRAPASLRRAANSRDCSSGLVITTPFPKRGFVSNQFRSSLSPTTLPTMKIAGGVNFRFSASSTIVSRVPARVSWSGVVPHRISAAGVSGSLPCAIRPSTIWDRFFTPMRNTTVPTAVMLSQSMPLSPFVGSSCPVTNATVDVKLRCVRGIPA